LAIWKELDRLHALPRYADPKCLVRFGYKAYSQADEDGIIAEIFRRIGTTNKTFVEFGCGTGLENNSVALLHQGWRGLWIDGSERLAAQINAAYASLMESGRLRMVRAMITRDNIDELIRANVDQEEIDLLSVDIDGNDAHVMRAITCIRPRVVIMEYNSKFVPPMMYCMKYNESHYWEGGDCFGASLKYLEKLQAERGYSLVGCNLSGANAFFVRNDLVADKFLAPFTAEHHYEPGRYYIAQLATGHPTSYKTLADGAI
jgi:hypothetical protein